MHKCITARSNIWELGKLDDLISSTTVVAHLKMGEMREGADNAYRGKVIMRLIFVDKIRSGVHYATERKYSEIMDIHGIDEKFGKPVVNVLQNKHATKCIPEIPEYYGVSPSLLTLDILQEKVD